jgi:hypothetical protein
MKLKYFLHSGNGADTFDVNRNGVIRMNFTVGWSDTLA